MKPSQILKSYHGKRMGIDRIVKVQQVRLDQVLDAEIDILKLDLQGYELQALRGCEQLLERIKLVTIEVEFAPLYENQSLFSDIDIFLRRNQFSLFNLYELWTHFDGQLTSGDALYLNKRYF
jgi:hypothetical protein